LPEGVGIIANLNSKAFDIFIGGLDDLYPVKVKQSAINQPIDPQQAILLGQRFTP
jgi:hypothetical protein